ncbi:MAG TPA: YheV family putative zinc ribbon protein [Cellvibrionaceae bacterium]
MTKPKTPTKKRFIAGAVCPKCAAMDTVITYRQDDKDWRGCVNCDFTEAMIFVPQVRELETRVNLDPEEKAAQTQVIKIL